MIRTNMETEKEQEKESVTLIELTEEELESMCGGRFPKLYADAGAYVSPDSLEAYAKAGVTW
jgi:hypothetical protein